MATSETTPLGPIPKWVIDRGHRIAGQLGLHPIRVDLTGEKWSYACTWCGGGFPAIEMAIVEMDTRDERFKWRRFCLDTRSCDLRRAVRP